jgi:hypothetical protein
VHLKKKCIGGVGKCAFIAIVKHHCSVDFSFFLDFIVKLISYRWMNGLSLFCELRGLNCVLKLQLTRQENAVSFQWSRNQGTC